MLTVAVMAARYFANNHERALGVLRLGGYLSGPLSASPDNWRRWASSGSTPARTPAWNSSSTPPRWP